MDEKYEWKQTAGHLVVPDFLLDTYRENLKIDNILCRQLLGHVEPHPLLSRRLKFACWRKKWRNRISEAWACLRGHAWEEDYDY